ncbi:MAG: hypothetical protein ABI430_01415 [Candidatus Taylorbacteria bacterium]
MELPRMEEIPESPNIEEILSAPFSYLHEGFQTRAFVSEDGKYVLKTFKTLDEGKQQFIAWGLDPDRVTQELVDNSEKSYKLAFHDFRQETALVYLHLEKSSPSLIEKVTLDGKEYNTRELQFILQEKVELVGDRIKKLIGADDIEGAKRVIDDVMNFIARMWERGVTEDTFNWDHNYGYASSGYIAQIDVGTFWKGEEYLKKEIEAKKLLDSVSSKWLKENGPQLVGHYEQKARELYEEYEMK